MQVKKQLSFTRDEADMIREAYAEYVLAGGAYSMNVWLKNMIMEKVFRNETE